MSETTKWVGWRLLKKGGGIDAEGSKMHVSLDNRRTLCGRKLPPEGRVFQWYYGQSSGEVCLRCEAILAKGER